MKKEQKRNNEDKGITLIALVITIIILLILAGVTLNAALSENGLFKKAKYAAEEYNKKAIEEQVQLLMAEKEMDAVSSNGKADITGVLEEMAGEGGITEEEINDFNNKYLQDYGEDEKIIAIKTAEDFNKIGTYGEYPLSGTYVQVNDFDELNITQPIGTITLKEDGTIELDNPFTGVYNGNGHKINNLTINDSEDSHGMISYNTGIIRDVTIAKCNITSSSGNMGAIVGTNSGLIENCSVLGGSLTVTPEEVKTGWESEYDGGICGVCEKGGIIRECKNSGNITGVTGVGGIVGYVVDGIVDKCYNFGKVQGYRYSGGIVGSSQGKTNVEGCFNEGDVSWRNNDKIEKVFFGGICGVGDRSFC